MARSKEGKKDEFYLSQIRALKSENRNLKKRIKQLEKRQHQYEDSQYDEEIELPIGEQNKEFEPICPECFKGKMESVSIVGRIFSQCSICGYRTKATKIGDSEI